MKHANLAACITLFMWGTLAGAQGMDGSATQACRDAEQIFSAKRPMPNDTGRWRGSIAWARVVLPSCGVEAARVVAQAVPAEGHNANPDSLRSFMQLVDNFRDATIFQALLTLAADQGSTQESRVWSLLALYRIVKPSGDLQYGMATQPAAPNGTLPCRGRITSSTDGSMGRPGEPLPTNAGLLLQDLLVRLQRDPSTPILVRNAAICVAS